MAGLFYSSIRPIPHSLIPAVPEFVISPRHSATSAFACIPSLYGTTPAIGFKCHRIPKVYANAPAHMSSGNPQKQPEAYTYTECRRMPAVPGQTAH